MVLSAENSSHLGLSGHSASCSQCKKSITLSSILSPCTIAQKTSQRNKLRQPLSSPHLFPLLDLWISSVLKTDVSYSLIHLLVVSALSVNFGFYSILSISRDIGNFFLLSFKLKYFTCLICTGNKCILFCFIYFWFIDYTKAFDFVDHNKLENSSRDGDTRPPYLPPEKSVHRSRSNS